MSCAGGVEPSANRDAAMDALDLARRCIELSDLPRATRLLHRARRLCPELDEIEAVERDIDAAEAAAAASSSGPEPPLPSTAAADKGSAEDPLADAPPVVAEVLRSRDAEDHYGVLGISNGPAATVMEMRKAYLRLCVKTHPDKCHHPLANRATQAIVEAWQLLSDPSLRAIYDANAAHAANAAAMRAKEAAEAEAAAKRAKQAAEAEAAKAAAAAKADAGTCCPICLETVSPSEAEADALPCHRAHFHKACIAKWLSANPTCPLCKRAAPYRGPFGGVGAGDGGSAGVPPPPRPPDYRNYYRHRDRMFGDEYGDEYDDEYYDDEDEDEDDEDEEAHERYHAEFSRDYAAYEERLRAYRERYGNTWEAQASAAEAARLEAEVLESSAREAARAQAAPFLDGVRAAAASFVEAGREAAAAWQRSQSTEEERWRARLGEMVAQAAAAPASDRPDGGGPSSSGGGGGGGSGGGGSWHDALCCLVTEATHRRDALRMACASWVQEGAERERQWLGFRRDMARAFVDGVGPAASVDPRVAFVWREAAAEAHTRAETVCNTAVQQVTDARHWELSVLKRRSHEAAVAAAKAVVDGRVKAWQQEQAAWQRACQTAAAAFEAEAEAEAARMLEAAARSGAHLDGQTPLPPDGAGGSSSSSSSTAHDGSPRGGSAAAVRVASVAAEAEAWRTARASEANAWAQRRYAAVAEWSAFRISQTDATRRSVDAAWAAAAPEAPSMERRSEVDSDAMKTAVNGHVEATLRRAAAATANGAEGELARASVAAARAERRARDAATQAATQAARGAVGAWQRTWQQAQAERERRRKAEEEQWVSAAERAAGAWEAAEVAGSTTRRSVAEAEARARCAQAPDWAEIGTAMRTFRVRYRMEQILQRRLTETIASTGRWQDARHKEAARWSAQRLADASSHCGSRKATAADFKTTFVADLCRAVGARSPEAARQWADKEGRPVVDFVCAETDARVQEAEAAEKDERSRVMAAHTRARSAATAAAERERARATDELEAVSNRVSSFSRAARVEVSAEAKAAAKGSEAKAAGAKAAGARAAVRSEASGKRPLSAEPPPPLEVPKAAMASSAAESAAGSAAGSAAAAAPLSSTKRAKWGAWGKGVAFHAGVGELPSPRSLSPGLPGSVATGAAASAHSACSSVPSASTPQTAVPHPQGLAPGWRRASSFLNKQPPRAAGPATGGGRFGAFGGANNLAKRK